VTMTICPSAATLRLIGTEAVGEVTFAGLEGHVEQCPDCQKILEAATKALQPASHPAPAGNTAPTLPGLVIERELGRGGASVVYLAREPALSRHVAVKLFPRHSLVDPHGREHWLGEARALSRVPHDHVVAIHRVDETVEWLWLVIEYVSGGTLKDRLTEPLPPRDAARLTETIARAVGYFHTRGVFHLDLKPSNILLDGEPGAPWETVSPKISDFGIARLEGEPGTTETGANGPKGTPSYMAPEQVAALPGTIGPAADIHALGALLYHLLTGRPPFQGASSAETLDQVRNQDPAPPRRLIGRIPRDLETICLTCLEKAPNRRYRTALALAGDLRLWLEGRPIKARRVSPMGHAWRLCRRHPAVAGLLITLATTLIAGVVGLFVLLNRVEAERARLAEARHNAEAYESFSASAADQLGLLLQTSIRHKRITTQDQMKASLLRLRNSTSDLRNRGIVPSATLGILEEEIGWALMSLGKNEEAGELLNQAIADLNLSLAKNPEDQEARYHLGDALVQTGQLAESAGQLEDALNCYEQASAIQRESEPSESTYTVLTFLYKRLQYLAERLGQSDRTGQKDRSRRVSQQILRHLLGSDVARSTDPSTPGLETLGRLFRRDDLKAMSSHEDTGIRRSHEWFVSQWLALSVEQFSPFRSSSVAAKYNRDPEAVAVALISAIREQCSKLGLADSMIPAAVFVLANDSTSVAGEQRKLGRLDDACATAARLMTIARQVVREYPNSAHSYLVLSEAYDQIKKNAFESNDDNLMMEALVQAVEAAQRSLALDPDRIDTRHHLEKLTAQLASIKADRKAASAALSQLPR
jgi:tetratricopeptide (TPR) repeat protein/tRNA A-37 threonylcarbamoyl transferase component Bud32